MVDDPAVAGSIPQRVANSGAGDALGPPVLGSYFIALSSGRNPLTGEEVADIDPAPSATASWTLRRGSPIRS